MILCDFTYVLSDTGSKKYIATCKVCGRVVTTKTTKAIASCRIVPKSQKPKPDELLQAGGVILSKAPITNGPGTELKKILKKWFGIEASAGCSCNSMAIKMDALGPDWCESESGLLEIINTMKNEYIKRQTNNWVKLPWSDLLAKKMIHIACKKARKQKNV